MTGRFLGEGGIEVAFAIRRGGGGFVDMGICLFYLLLHESHFHRYMDGQMLSFSNSV